jgi:hypothetical protein
MCTGMHKTFFLVIHKTTIGEGIACQNIVYSVMSNYLWLFSSITNIFQPKETKNQTEQVS